jgi:hypothetical protein
MATRKYAQVRRVPGGVYLCIPPLFKVLNHDSRLSEFPDLVWMGDDLVSYFDPTMTFELLFRVPLEFIRLRYQGVLYELTVRPPARGGTVDDLSAVLYLPPPPEPVPADSDEYFACEWGPHLRGLLGPQFASHWLRSADARDFPNLFPDLVPCGTSNCIDRARTILS